MDAAERQQHAKVAALAAAGLVAAAAITPASPLPSLISVTERQLRLVADEASLLNVPLNFFQALVNIPSNELGAMTLLGNSLLFSGDWWAPNATNIWGEDPGDPGHFMAVVDSLIPFPAISGQGQPEPGYIDPADPTGPTSFSWADAAAGHLGLGQQITLLVDAELPVSASSDADWSAPMYPVTEITGSTFIDRNIWFFASLFGLQKYPLFDNWYQVPVSDLQNGYTFPTIANPSYGIGPGGSVPADDFYRLAGTHTATINNVPAAELAELQKPVSEGGSGYTVATPEQVGTVSPAGATIEDGDILNTHGDPVQLMPWSNEMFTLNLQYPFENFWNSLQQPFDPGNFQIPTFQDVGQAFQTLLAGSIVAFDPWTAGNPLCGVGCNNVGLEPQSLIALLNKVWPGNPSIEHWLDQVNTPGAVSGPYGSASGPTDHQVDFTSAYAQSIQQWFDIGNPTTDGPPSNVDTPIAFETSPAIQNLITLMKDTGVQNFFANWAKIAGYQTVNPEALLAPDGSPGPDAGDLAGGTDVGDAANGAAAAPNWLMDLTAGINYLLGLENIGSLGIF